MKKIVLCMALLSYAMVQADFEDIEDKRYPSLNQSILRYFASSSSLHNFARNRRGELAQSAPNQYTSLFNDAQREAGIAEHDMLPVTVVSRSQVEDKEGYAYTSKQGIYIISEKFEKLAYGAKRIIALHESYHHKYHDSAFVPWLLTKVGQITFGIAGLTTVGLWSLVSLHTSSRWRIPGYAVSPVVAFVSAALLQDRFFRFIGFNKPYSWVEEFHEYKEFRADRDAVTQARCHECVKEYATIADSSADSSLYLTADELTVYYDQFKKTDALCGYHGASLLNK